MLPLPRAYRGAFVNFACVAEDAAASVALLQRELAGNDLQITGFDWFIDPNFADETPADYHAKLMGRLDSYPVQYTDIHLYKPDT